MGANAQTSVPVFTSGQVLTAQQQTEINTGIPVFATSVERDAAFGGTGEKTLAEGQFAFLEDTNATQFYDGAVWQAVGVTPGLVCVKAETTVSSVASATADNVFTSTYTNYLILAKFGTSTTQSLQMKFRAGGVSTSTNYNRQRFVATSTTVNATQDINQTVINLGSSNGLTNFAWLNMNISSPQLATQTLLNVFNGISNANYTTGLELFQIQANQNSSTQFDGVEFLVASGTFSGTYSIYGYSKTV
jgi:hypothetical protein